MNKVIIISGLSKGLGLGLAKNLLKKNWKVAGFSRKKTPQISVLEKKYKKKFLFKPISASEI